MRPQVLRQTDIDEFSEARSGQLLRLRRPRTFAAEGMRAALLASLMLWLIEGWFPSFGPEVPLGISGVRWLDAQVAAAGYGAGFGASSSRAAMPLPSAP